MACEFVASYRKEIATSTRDEINQTLGEESYGYDTNRPTEKGCVAINFHGWAIFLLSIHGCRPMRHILSCLAVNDKRKVADARAKKSDSIQS